MGWIHFGSVYPQKTGNITQDNVILLKRKTLHDKIFFQNQRLCIVGKKTGELYSSVS